MEDTTNLDLFDAYLILVAAKRVAMDSPAVNVVDYRTISHACDYITKQPGGPNYMEVHAAEMALLRYASMMGNVKQWD